MRIVCLGDLLLDVIVRLDEPLAFGADAIAVTSSGAGGQAANVAAWAAELGADARFVGKRASDAAGRVVDEQMRARGVELSGPIVEGGNGIVVSLVAPDGDRTMASDRGVAPDLEPGELDPDWFADVDVLHLSGYSLMRSPIDDAALRAADLARAGGARISVDLSAWTRIREFGAVAFRERLEELAPDVAFANEPEWEIVGGAYGLAPTSVIKRGARGIRVVGTAPADVAAVAADVVDATGAGDALAAGFLVGGPQLAVETAARCVAKLGTMP
ncbi:MAG: carbohydrate kinase family protein [Gaiellaceae bacterium]